MIALTNQEKELLKKYRKRKRYKFLYVSIGVCFIVAIVIFGYVKKDYIQDYFKDIELELTSNTVEIGLSQVDLFNAKDHIKSYDQKCTLSLPKYTFSKEAPGKYDLIYKLKNKAKQIEKKLVVVVKDDVPPVLELTVGEIQININDEMDYLKYISKASDNVDGNIDSKKITYTTITTATAGTYSVVYGVEDSAKNKTTMTLLVNIKEQKLENNISHETSNNVNNEPVKPSNNPPVKVEVAAKDFRVTEYNNDFTNCLNAARQYANNVIATGNVKTANIDPIVENGIYVGYMVSFK